MVSFLDWLQQSWFGAGMRESSWLFPTIETVHLAGLVVLVGATSALDLRLLDFAMRRRAVSTLARLLLPWAWVGLGVMVVTGGLLFSATPLRFWPNGAFRIKLVMLLLAGVNVLLFHMTVFRRVEEWDRGVATPSGAKIAGAVSIVL